MKKPKLSVIITNYNKLPMLGFLINYFIRHQRKDVEVILISEGTGDIEKIRSLCPPHCNITVCCNTWRQGIGYVRQQGLQLSKGEYICYIDGDDIITEDYLDVILDKLERDPNEDVYEFEAISYPDGQIDGFKDMVWNKVYRKEFIDICNCQFKKMDNGEDVDFNEQIFSNKPHIGYIDKTIYIYNKLFTTMTHYGYMEEYLDEIYGRRKH